jgi:hypothetical protein
VRRLELEAGIEPSHYEPGAHPIAVEAEGLDAEAGGTREPDRSEVGV